MLVASIDHSGAWMSSTHFVTLLQKLIMLRMYPGPCERNCCARHTPKVWSSEVGCAPLVQPCGADASNPCPNFGFTTLELHVRDATTDPIPATYPQTPSTLPYIVGNLRSRSANDSTTREHSHTPVHAYKMIRRNARERRDYLYRRALTLKDAEPADKRAALKASISTGKPLNKAVATDDALRADFKQVFTLRKGVFPVN